MKYSFIFLGVVGATAMNVESSRSHAIYSTTIESTTAGEAEQHVRVGRLHLVDLAVRYFVIYERLILAKFTLICVHTFYCSRIEI